MSQFGLLKLEIGLVGIASYKSCRCLCSELLNSCLILTLSQMIFLSINHSHLISLDLKYCSTERWASAIRHILLWSYFYAEIGEGAL